MNNVTRQFRDFFVSMKLTVVLLVAGLLLVFFATLDQVNLGVWGIQQKWFHSLFVLHYFGEVPVPIFPGGYLIGGLLLINLIAAHVYRFRFTWKKTGIQLAHFGLILLLLGELLSGILQRDFHLRLTEGETKNYAESSRLNELAIIETTDPKVDDVVAIPEQLLARGKEFQHPRLPFRVVVREYFPNSVLQLRSASATTPPPATQGIGPRTSLIPVPVTYKQDEQNMPAAIIELVGAEGSLGTWLATTFVADSQTVNYAGRTWRLGLRAERLYQPFSLTLLKVTHDVYLGTDIPKNFSSRVRITAPEGREDREALIYMNNPLRYGGLTFYQYQMDSEHASSVLQVVRNPSWILPYVSCALITVGLVVQFCIHLFGFVAKRRRVPAAA
jgi:hypothetical protein